MSGRRLALARVLRIGAWSAAAALLAGGLWLLPAGLRDLDRTRVRRVEITGVHYLAPQDALAASGIGAASSMFDDPAEWRDRLVSHPLVESATIRRRLPGTVRIAVTEVRPVALVRTPELRVVDARGRVLPIEPWRRDVDLPVLRPATDVDDDGFIADPALHSLLAELIRLEAALPVLARHISELEPLRDGGLRVVLRGGGADALLPPAADEERLRRLGMILNDLSARAELESVRRIDARYQEQVVVAFDSRKGS